MKFYDCQTAPSPRRLRMFIAEKGITVEHIEINMREKEQLSEAFLKINPYATVPVLELDDGTRLTSTAGGRAYLESAFPTPALLGRNDTEKGVIADRLWRIEADGFSAIGECLRNSAKGMQGRAMTGPRSFEQIPALAERGKLRAELFYPALDAMIGDQAFIVGSDISAADIDAFIFVEFSKWIKVEMPADCKNVARWHAAMAERPSAKL